MRGEFTESESRSVVSDSLRPHGLQHYIKNSVDKNRVLRKASHKAEDICNTQTKRESPPQSNRSVRKNIRICCKRLTWMDT